MKLSTLSMALLATAVTASASSIIHLPGAKDSAFLDESVWNATKPQKDQNPFKTQCLRAPEAETGYENFQTLWVDRIDDSEAETEEQYNKLIALNDGCYLEVYTAGAGTLFFEGRITMLDSEGNEKWSDAIQLGSYTRATNACQDSQGNIFVSCTTLEDNTMIPYIVSYSADGTKGVETRLSDGAAYCSIIGLEGRQEGYSVVFSEGMGVWSWVFDVTISARNTEGEEVGTCTVVTQTADPTCTSRLGDILMIPFYTGEVLFFNISDGTLALRDQTSNYEAYHNGCVSGQALFLIYAARGGNICLSKYEVDGNEVKRVWSMDTHYIHNSFNLYAFPANDGGVIIYAKTLDMAQAMIIDSEGLIVAENSNIKFEKKLTNNWIYSGGQIEDGSVVLFGMTENTFELALVKLDEDLLPVTAKAISNIKPGYIYSYSYDNCSKLIGNYFLFSGFIRPEDYWNHGHTPVFAKVDATTMDFEWAVTADPGNVIRIDPASVTVDGEGNAYAFYLSGVIARLSRYNSKGKLEWSKVIAKKKVDHYLKPALLSNGNIVCGIVNDDLILEGTCFDPDGQKVYEFSTESFNKYLKVETPVVAEIGNTAELMICMSLLTKEDSFPYIMKVNAQGEVVLARTLEGFEDIISPSVKTIVSDSEGGVVISGSAMTLDNVTCPMIARIDADGNTLWAQSTPTDAYCPMEGIALNNKGIIYGIANTSYQGVLFVYDEADGELKFCEEYANSTKFSTHYNALAVDNEGNALIGASYISEYWTYEAKAISYGAQGDRLWDVSVYSDNGDYYTCDNIGLINDQPVLLVTSQSYYTPSNELLVFLTEDDVEGTVTCVPADSYLQGFQVYSTAIKDNRAYVFYTTRFGDNVYYGNLCCVGAYEEADKQEQTIEWEQTFEGVIAGDVIELTAAATSGLEVTYTIVKGEEFATISGSTLTIISDGEIIIEASQEGNNEWLAATPVVKEIFATTAISTTINEAQTPVYFNLQGIRMPQGQLPAGIYIKRQGDRTEKVVIR